ncbi:MAG: ABC transporter ATP-binding protein, partial [Ktedonobacteraceae bacterium]
IVLSCSKEEFESRYVEVGVKPDQAAAARAFKPMYERHIFGRSVLLFDLKVNSANRQQLNILGEVRTPSIADLFVAVMENQSRRAQGASR